MAIQTSDTVAQARLDAFETATGATAILRLFSGAAPANCAAASSGTLIAEMTLPSDWMNAASGRTKTKLGTWQDLLANSAGTIGHFRIFNSAGAVCHMQGTVTITGGGGDMTVDNNVVAINQTITVSTFTLTEPNA